MPSGDAGCAREPDDRRKADAALWREQKLFREGPVTVFRWVATEGWPVEYVSPNVIQFGYSAEDFTSGRVPYAAIIHPEDVERVTAEVAAHSASGESTFEQDYRIVCRDGDVRWIFDRTVVVRDATGTITHYAGYILDVTDRKRAEEEHRRLEAQIRHAQKLESLGVLAGGIAHDFNNLLMGILGHASLALLDLSVSSHARESVHAIELAARRAAELTNQMLAYSGRGRFRIERVNLSSLVAEMAQLLATVISKKAELVLDLADPLPFTEADATQIRQIVMNLITNASDALEERPGRIVVSTGTTDVAAHAPGCALPLDAAPEGPCVFLEVTDNGVGMDEVTRGRIFDPFFTTKATGRGLGLAAVLGIVRGHRGTIHVSSVPGRGTSMRVILPVARIQAPIRAAAPLVVPSNWNEGGTVLVVDDEPTVRDITQRMLLRLGFEPLLAVDGREGIELFRAAKNRLAAVLLDLTMPQKGGDEVLAEIRQTHPDLPVILSSGYDEQDTRPRVSSSGHYLFLQKPYSIGDLQSRLFEALRGRRRGAPSRRKEETAGS